MRALQAVGDDEGVDECDALAGRERGREGGRAGGRERHVPMARAITLAFFSSHSNPKARAYELNYDEKLQDLFMASLLPSLPPSLPLLPFLSPSPSHHPPHITLLPSLLPPSSFPPSPPLYLPQLPSRKNRTFRARGWPERGGGKSTWACPLPRSEEGREGGKEGGEEGGQVLVQAFASKQG